MTRVARAGAALAFMVGCVCGPAAALDRAPSPPPGVADEDEGQQLLRQAVALGVPEAELTDLVRRCREAGFASVEVRRVLALVRKAKLAGLPHDDLLNKLREGLAKRAPPEAVERAVEGKAQSLRRAKTLVDLLLSEGCTAPNYVLALQCVADALEGGADPADVLRAVREGGSLGPGLPEVGGAFRKMR